jgi:hypothetical protein
VLQISQPSPKGLLQASGSGTPLSSAPPPSSFRCAEGVRAAWPSAEGPFGRTPSPLSSGKRRGTVRCGASQKGTPAQRMGLRYERKVLSYLSGVFPGFIPSQWFRYASDAGTKWCQVDGLLLLPGGKVLIFEVKYSFVEAAWWQLRKLYEPVVRRAYYAREVGLCLICRSYDPSKRFPEEVELLPDLKIWGERPSFSKIGVFSWKP